MGEFTVTEIPKHEQDQDSINTCSASKRQKHRRHKNERDKTENASLAARVSPLTKLDENIF